MFVTWLLVLVICHVGHVSGQGLTLSAPVDKILGASNSIQAALGDRARRARAFRQSFHRSPGTACSSGSCTLKSSGGDDGDTDSAQVLTMATSPFVYSSTNSSFTDGKEVVNPALKQTPCNTCTAFATISAAETAVATVGGIDASDVDLSIVDLYYCSSQVRTCRSGSTLQAVLQDLKSRGPQLLASKCLPYNPNDKSFMDSLSVRRLCSAKKCSDTNRFVASGTFDFVPLADPTEVMQYIRAYGSVVTAFMIMSDFKPFYDKPANKKAVYQHSPDATFVEGHAITLIGYNLDEGWWLAKNSWGPDWADSGMFRLPLNFEGFLAGSTYGVTWVPDSALASPFASVAPADKKPGCCLYNATAFDYISKIARLADIDIDKFLADNKDTISNLDESLKGKTMLLCPPKGSTICQPPAAQQAVDGDARTGQQLQALLDIKESVDPAGIALTAWNQGIGANGGYCSPVPWPGLQCTGDGQVTRINFEGVTIGLSGTLPSGQLLKKLPGLVTVNIGQNSGLKGTLPSDWADLTQLTDITVIGTSVTGKLPDGWAALKGLQQLRLWGNDLSGPLPSSWLSLRSLTTLQLTNNALTGTLPPSWAAMSKLTDLKIGNEQVQRWCANCMGLWHEQFERTEV